MKETLITTLSTKFQNHDDIENAGKYNFAAMIVLFCRYISDIKSAFHHKLLFSSITDWLGLKVSFLFSAETQSSYKPIKYNIIKVNHIMNNLMEKLGTGPSFGPIVKSAWLSIYCIIIFVSQRGKNSSMDPLSSLTTFSLEKFI